MVVRCGQPFSILVFPCTVLCPARPALPKGLCELAFCKPSAEKKRVLASGPPLPQVLCSGLKEDGTDLFVFVSPAVQVSHFYFA